MNFWIISNLDDAYQKLKKPNVRFGSFWPLWALANSKHYQN